MSVYAMTKAIRVPVTVAMTDEPTAITSVFTMARTVRGSASRTVKFRRLYPSGPWQLMTRSRRTGAAKTRKMTK